MENRKSVKTVVKHQGFVKWFDPDKLYGFIESVKPIGEFLCDQIKEQFSIDESEIEQFINERERPEDDLFCHSNSIIIGNEEEVSSGTHFQNNKYKKLKQNDKVEFFIKLVQGRGQAREQACYICLV